MEELSLDTVRSRVAYILDRIPATRSDDVLLMLTYWQVFDELPISDELAEAIIERGTSPDTISRRKREVMSRRRYEQVQRLKQEVESFGKRGHQDKDQQGDR